MRRYVSGLTATYPRRPGWGPLLLSLFTNALLPLPAHEATRHAFEHSLDPRETRSLAMARSLTPGLGARGTVANSHCQLALTVSDPNGQPRPAIIRIKNERGEALELSGLISRGVKLRANHPAKSWYVMVEPTVLTLPRERLTLEAFSGLETELTRAELDLRGKETGRQAVALRPFVQPAATGWHAGNTHLHLRGMTRAQADEYLRSVPRADGLALVFVSYLERANADADYITNRYSAADLAALAGSGLQFGHGQEHRHNIGSGGEGYGHVMFLDLPRRIEPVSIGAGITGVGPDYPPLRRGIARARAQGSTIIWCHNAFGFEHAPSWIAGTLHAQNIFDGGSQGGYGDTFYRLLNAGLDVPFSTGTDWFIYDFSRVYARVKEPLAAAGWLKALTAGRTFITNGPLLELTVDGHEIGDTVALPAAGMRRLRARAIGRADFGALEIVQNGSVVARVPSRASGGHFVAASDHSLELRESGWVAARVSSGTLDGDGPIVVPPNLPMRATGRGTNEMGEALFAHTSPIYFEVAGQRRFDRSAAASLITRLEESREAIRAKARFDHDAQREEVLQLYASAIDVLQRRMK